MKGPRIMVFHLREIIKIAMIILIGVILIAFLIFIMTPKNNSQAVYTPGTYTAQIVLHNKAVDIEVTVNESAITGIDLKNMDTVQESFYPLFKPTLEELTEEIIKYQTTKIAADSEKTVTSKILLDAVDSALGKAFTSAEASR